MTTYRGSNGCVYESHTVVADDDLTELDNNATHVAQNNDRPSVRNAVCDFHADWLRKRGGWTVTPLERAA